MKMISLFTGAGGLDYGFEAAGFKTAVAIEWDKDAAATLRASRDWPVLEGDIHDIDSQTILRKAGLKKGEVAVLIGGPPCQPFSKAAYWARGNAGGLDDPRADTLFAYMRVVRDTLPQVFVLENVHGIAYTGKEQGLSVIFKVLEEINKQQGVKYTPSWRLINAADYGVPQLRSRFFLVAHREGASFQFPKQTHWPKVSSSSGERKRYATAWDAIGAIAPNPDEDLGIKGKWADLLPSIPEGQNYLWHTPRGGGVPLFGWRTRYWNFLLKLAKNQPSWTIPASPGPATGPFHWENRLLSVRELAAIQTFPKDVHFKGRRLSVQRQIGNAVPSLLAEILARQIAQQYFGATFSTGPTLAVPLQDVIPDPEPISEVPAKYLHLVGEHPEHPGIGRGPKGRLRAAQEELFAVSS